MDTTESIKSKVKKKSRIKQEGLFKPNNFIDDLMDEYDNGLERGTSTFFPQVDEIFTWMRTYINCWFGYGGHGKSEILRHLFLLKSKFDGYKWAIFAAENMSYKNGRVNANRYISSLAHSLIGRNPDPYWKSQPKKEVYREAINFVNEHFIFIYPPEIDKNVDLILEYFQYAVDFLGIDGFAIDPWNKLIHNYIGTIDEYLGVQFAKIKDFSVRNNQIANICAHMAKENRIKKDGSLTEPNQHMLAGGAMWDNSMDVLISIFKPNHGRKFRDENGNLPSINDDPNLAILKSHKIREHELVGYPGDVTLYFNNFTRRYEFILGVDPVYGTRKGLNPLNKNYKELLQDYEEDQEQAPF